MRKRRKLSKRSSKKMFKRTANTTHVLNKIGNTGIGQRGGRRL